MPQIPKESRLFLHYDNGSLYCHGKQTSYNTDSNFNQLSSQPCPQIASNRPFSHFYNAIPNQNQFFALMNGKLLKLSNFAVSPICDLPSPSSEKYKLFAVDDALLFVDDQGRVFKYANASFQLTEIDFLLGDSYVLSKQIGGQAVQIAVNLTKCVVFVKFGERTVQQKIDPFLTLDFLCPFYAILHCEYNNFLVDFTDLGTEFQVYESKSRVREIEWNRVSGFLEAKRDVLVLQDEFLAQFDGLDVNQLKKRCCELFPEGFESKRPSCITTTSNDVWKFGLNCAQELPIQRTVEKAQGLQNAAICTKNDVFGAKIGAKSIENSVSGPSDVQKLVIQQAQKISVLEGKMQMLERNQEFYSALITDLVDLLPEGKKEAVLAKMIRWQVSK
ncbi:hypothetical protein SS50377_21771 [Spironucleus salmonicida]|uniref:Uncharacterized protein n=1 Tax=Spironucleus salmonicida TaxID=348837 RepID=V6LFU4_9EUKA|nr:hypothetical protein SS50377_21771 [Spironucleus salmonicida]|eukprot:EST43420.1 Hypothetical protein SS50377_16882 [Spironucleus salmonicida]